MIKSKLWMVFFAVLGALAALATTSIISVLANKSTAPNVEGSSSSAAREDQSQGNNLPASALAGQDDSRRLDALEKAIAQLREERQEKPSAINTPVASNQPSPPSPEEERVRLEQQFGELERRLASDAVDPGWSRDATAYLQAGLTKAQNKGKFTLESAECRTEMCRATVRWDSYHSALETGLHLPEQAIPGLNCASSIWLKEPQNPAGAYVADLYLDCSQQQRGEAEPITMSRGDEP